MKHHLRQPMTPLKITARNRLSSMKCFSFHQDWRMLKSSKRHRLRSILRISSSAEKNSSQLHFQIRIKTVWSVQPPLLTSSQQRQKRWRRQTPRETSSPCLYRSKTFIARRCLWEVSRPSTSSQNLQVNSTLPDSVVRRGKNQSKIIIITNSDEKLIQI